MIYLKWFFLSLSALALNAIMLPLVPVAVLFADRAGRLPNWLSWFATPDNSADGDFGWQTEHWRWRHNLPRRLARYVGRVGWLWRNLGHGFDTAAGGVTVPVMAGYRVGGDEFVSNRPLRNGWVFRRVWARDDLIAFQFYGVWAWSERFCLRVNLGWKIWGRPAPNTRLQHVISINPFMGFEHHGH